MIERCPIEVIKHKLDLHPRWNVVDMGCQIGGWSQAGTYVDLSDLHGFYSQPQYNGKRFVQSDVCKTPFRDQEFDFAIASHIAEHVVSPAAFIRELERIAAGGYIEVPLPLFDNLVYGNPEHHIWWTTFDDTRGELVFRPRRTLVQESVTIEMWNFLGTHFRESTVLQLYWWNRIPFRVEGHNGAGLDVPESIRNVDLVQNVQSDPSTS